MSIGLDSSGEDQLDNVTGTFLRRHLEHCRRLYEELEAAITTIKSANPRPLQRNLLSLMEREQSTASGDTSLDAVVSAPSYCASPEDEHQGQAKASPGSDQKQ